MAEYLEDWMDFDDGIIRGGIFDRLTFTSSVFYFTLFGLNFLFRYSYRLP